MAIFYFEVMIFGHKSVDFWCYSDLGCEAFISDLLVNVSEKSIIWLEKA